MGWKQKINIGNTKNTADYHKLFDCKLNLTRKQIKGATEGYTSKLDRNLGDGPTTVKFSARTDVISVFDEETGVETKDYSEYEAFLDFEVRGVKLRDVLIPAYYELIKRKNPELKDAIKE